MTSKNINQSKIVISELTKKRFYGHVYRQIDYADNEKEVLDFMIENTFIYPEDMVRRGWRKLISGMIDRGYIEYNDVDSLYELTDKAYYSGYVQKCYLDKDKGE